MEFKESITPLPDPNEVLAATAAGDGDESPVGRQSETAADLLASGLSPTSLKKELTMKFKDPDDPDAATHAEFRVILSSGNPLNSTFWYVMKHPVSRIFAAVFIMFLNFFVYFGDPASYSVAMSYGTLLGDIYHGFFQPDDATFMVPRIIFMVVTGFAGMALGGVIQRRLLRDYFRIEMFGYDRFQGADPDRLDEQSNDGGLFVSIMTTALCWYFGLMIYNEFLIAFGAHEDHHLDEGMHNWTFAGYNLVLAGIFAFVSDWWNIITVIDQMLQDFDKSAATKGHVATASTGYKAYGKHHPKLIEMGHWWEDNRLIITKVWLLVGWGTIVPLMIHHFNLNMRIVEHQLDEAMGDGWFWATWNNEFTRMAVAAAVACMNMLIVMQDWDFPDMNGEDVKIAATDFTEININWSYLKSCGPVFKWVFDHLTFYISGKWFNYMNIFIAVGFDWSYWYMTALVFRPCDYAQFWDSETGYIFTMDDRDLALEHAGAAAAKDCPWFTDNKLQNGWRQNGTEPYVARVATGTFTGVYTVDEEDEYIFGGWAAVLWLFCIPPILSYLALGYIIATHDKLVGNKKMKRVQKWLAGREELHQKDHAGVLEELKATHGAVDSHLLHALEKFENTKCGCIAGAKNDVAEQDDEGTELPTTPTIPGEETKAVIATKPVGGEV